MDRRKALKTMAAIALPVGFLTEPQATVQAKSIDALGEYTFLHKVELGDGVWSVYFKNKLALPVILDKETFKACRPFAPVFVQERIGRREADGKIKEFPDVIVKNQNVWVYNTENINEHLLIVT